MSNEAVRAILEGRLQAIWGSSDNVDWDNGEFTPTLGVSFLKPVLEQTFAERLSNRCQRVSYLFSIIVNSPKGEGANPNNLICDSLINGFIPFESGLLSCKNARAERFGDKKEWFRKIVLIELEFENHN